MNGKPVVARTLVLAHKMQAMIDRGRFADQAGLARMFGFARARISQMLDLTLLVPLPGSSFRILRADGNSPGLS